MNLIFSSVGDFSNFPKWWLNKKSLKEFDIYVCYYGGDMVKAKEIENQSRDSEFLRLQALEVRRSVYHPNKSSSSQVLI